MRQFTSSFLRRGAIVAGVIALGVSVFASSALAQTDGKKTVNHHNPGDVVFNVANRSHSEELVKGEQSGIMMELK